MSQESHDNNDDDVPQLSAETFAALQEFYKEQEERENNVDITSIKEDWQLSQFWYDQETIDKLADIAVKSVDTNGRIALISCPSLFKVLKEKHDGEVTLFEYDQRFSIYGKDFLPYDYKSPLEIPRERLNYYDLVIADPPFLSEECLTKTSVTIKYLTKQRILLCTGAVMYDLIQRLLNLKKTQFLPKHKNNLANEFWCYSNYDIDTFL